MWDSNALSQLLKSMPNKLSKENLEKIQLVIDADKYKNSLLSGFDLCDMYMYAPFCKGCKKTSIYPCAIAYVNMMKTQGVDVEVDAKPVTGGNNAAFIPKPIVEPPVMAEEKPLMQEQAVEEIAATASVEEAAVEEATEAQSEEQNVEQVYEVSEEQAVEKAQAFNEAPKVAGKRKIRIAVARKKI